MKEYLLKTEDGKWIHSNTGESFSYVEKIEIPNGAEIAVEFNEDNSGVAFYRKNGKEYANKSTEFVWFGGSKWTLQELLDENFKVDGMDLSHKIIWQREPKYKEFLNSKDGYKLVMLPEHAGDDERSGLIEVPQGAELCTLLKEYLIFWKGTKNKRPHYDDWLECNHKVDDYLNEYKDAKIVWQRYTQPESLPFVDDEVQSINDQYTEIEQVRQAIKVKSGSDSDHALDAMSYGLMGGIDATLSERQSTYGNFEDVAFVTENIINVLKKCNYDYMPHTHKMAMYMIASKMARLVNGDCDHLDSWHDIGGYSKLIEKLIKGEQ